MGKTKTIAKLALAVLLTPILLGASCGKPAVNPAEMDFTGPRNKANEAATAEFWQQDVPHTVVQMTSDNQFSPQTITVPSGRSIMWQNGSRADHIIASDSLEWRRVGLNTSSGTSLGSVGLSSTKIPHNRSWRWQIPKGTKSGTKIYYHCALHGQAGDGKSFGTGMVGLIVVK